MIRYTGAFLLLFLLTSCTTAEYSRGHFLRESQLRQMMVGQTTQAQVKKELGPPQFISLFDTPKWYYVGVKKKTFMSFQPHVTKQEIYVFSFNKSHTLQKISFYDASKRRTVPMNPNITPLPEKESGLFTKLLGNVGAIGALAPSSSSPGGP